MEVKLILASISYYLIRKSSGNIDFKNENNIILITVLLFSAQ